jgi:ABC-type nitrate/sulfonate/bicarbonate transport system substrate-binding protein
MPLPPGPSQPPDDRPPRRAALGLLGGWLCAIAAPPGLAQVSAVRPAIVAVPGPGSSVSLPFELALRLGIDREAGLPVRLKFVGGGGVIMQDLQGGNAEFAAFGLPAAMEANAAGTAQLVALAAVHGLPVYSLLVRSDLRASVRRIADLDGRTVGLHNNSLQNRTTAQQLAEQIFASSGVPVDRVRFMSSGMSWESMSAALRSRSVDAVMADGTLAIRLEDEGLAYRLFSTGVPADAETVPGAGFLRAALIGRRDRVEAEPERAARMVAIVRRTLEWIASRGPEAMADALQLQGSARQAVLSAARLYPQQYSTDGRFSTRQLKDTDVFFRSSNPHLPEAVRFSADSMVLDRWAGRKP